MCFFVFFFFKQKTAYEMRISDWSSDVCSSDLAGVDDVLLRLRHLLGTADGDRRPGADMHGQAVFPLHFRRQQPGTIRITIGFVADHALREQAGEGFAVGQREVSGVTQRSEEHTSELQSLMRISYAVFCLQKKKNKNSPTPKNQSNIHTQ